MALISESITSPANPLIKTLRALDRKKTRQETNLFLAEGARLVRQGLEKAWHIDTLIMAKTSLERDHVRALADQAQSAGARLVNVPDRLLSQITRKDNPGAVLASFRQQDKAPEHLSKSGPAIWLGLYKIRDPGNLGTILRTADCAGLAGIVLIETCCDPYSVEAVRASMGAIFDTDFATASFEAFNTWRHCEGLPLIGASLAGTARPDEIAFQDRAVILMGNEQAGLPGEIEAACDTLCRIPMRAGADSLNLAQATALMSYEAWRQQGYPGAAR